MADLPEVGSQVLITDCDPKNPWGQHGLQVGTVATVQEHIPFNNKTMTVRVYGQWNSDISPDRFAEQTLMLHEFVPFVIDTPAAIEEFLNG